MKKQEKKEKKRITKLQKMRKTHSKRYKIMQIGVTRKQNYLWLF